MHANTTHTFFVRLCRRLAEFTAQIRDLLAYAPAARWTAIAFLCVFLIQRVADRVECVQGYTFAHLLLYCFGLCPDLLAAGFFWQPVTYLFLHLNWLHLSFNTLAILLLGAGVEMEIGTRRFLRLFLLGGIVGGLAWALFDLATVQLAASCCPIPGWLHALATRAAGQRMLFGGYAVCIGASGGAFALVGACAALFPRRRMLVFLVIPVRTRTLALTLGVLAAWLIFSGYAGNVAHLTHLAGGLAGYWYGRRLAAQGWGDEATEP